MVTMTTIFHLQFYVDATKAELITSDIPTKLPVLLEPGVDPLIYDLAMSLVVRFIKNGTEFF